MNLIKVIYFGYQGSKRMEEMLIFSFGSAILFFVSIMKEDGVGIFFPPIGLILI